VNRYRLVVSRAAVKLERRWEVEEGSTRLPTRGGGGTNAGGAGHSTAGGVMVGWSAQSRRAMRWRLASMRWELLGARPAMVTLTYPGDWAAYAPDGRQVKRQLEAFKERWRRAHGRPRGVWVEEFQERGAPHFHMYLGLPESVTDADYAQLVRRTIRRRQLEQRMGKFQARRSAGLLKGEFAEWLLGAWSGVLGTEGTPHARFGADVAPFFWGGTVAEAAKGNVNWSRISEYLWAESGKWGQKEAPPGFGSPGRLWGVWDVDGLEGEREVSPQVAMQIRRVLFHLYRARIARSRAERGLRPVKVRRTRGRDGLTVFALDGPEVAGRLVTWAESLAADGA
jgi:hypothetical protein